MGGSLRKVYQRLRPCRTPETKMIPCANGNYENQKQLKTYRRAFEMFDQTPLLFCRCSRSASRACEWGHSREAVMLPKVKLTSAPPEPSVLWGAWHPFRVRPTPPCLGPAGSGRSPRGPAVGTFSFPLLCLNAFTAESRVQGVLVESGQRKASCPAGPPRVQGAPRPPRTSSSSPRTFPLLPCQRLPAPLEIGRSS